MMKMKAQKINYHKLKIPITNILSSHQQYALRGICSTWLSPPRLSTHSSETRVVITTVRCNRRVGGGRYHHAYRTETACVNRSASWHDIQSLPIRYSLLFALQMKIQFCLASNSLTAQLRRLPNFHINLANKVLFTYSIRKTTHTTTCYLRRELAPLLLTLNTRTNNVNYGVVAFLSTYDLRQSVACWNGGRERKCESKRVVRARCRIRRTVCVL